MQIQISTPFGCHTRKKSWRCGFSLLAFAFCPLPFDLLFSALPPCAPTRLQISFSWTPMSARPFAVGGRLAVPSVYIAAEPGSAARRRRNQIVARPSWPCRSRAGRPCHNVGAPLVGALASAMPTGRAGTRPAPTSSSSCARCRRTACRPLGSAFTLRNAG